MRRSSCACGRRSADDGRSRAKLAAAARASACAWRWAAASTCSRRCRRRDADALARHHHRRRRRPVPGAGRLRSISACIADPIFLWQTVGGRASRPTTPVRTSRRVSDGRSRTWWLEGYMTTANFVQFESRAAAAGHPRRATLFRLARHPHRRAHDAGRVGLALRPRGRARRAADHLPARRPTSTPSLAARPSTSCSSDEESAASGEPWMHRGLIALILLSVGCRRARHDARDPSPAGISCLSLVEIVCVGVFTVEYAARVWVAVEDRAGRYDHPFWGRLRYMATPMAIDRPRWPSCRPTWPSCCPATSFSCARLRILRVLKITRYSPALATFEIVLVNERRSLMAAGDDPGRGAAAGGRRAAPCRGRRAARGVRLDPGRDVVGDRHADHGGLRRRRADHAARPDRRRARAR